MKIELSLAEINKLILVVSNYPELSDIKEKLHKVKYKILPS